MSITRFQIFGSKSSQDYDVMFFLDNLSQYSISERKELCYKFDNDLHNYFIENGYDNKDINSNICEVKDGIVINTYKGCIDEVNNSMYLTYNNFTQLFDNKIEKLVDRDVDLKILRGYRIILSYLSRSIYRKEVKCALKGTLHEKITTIENIDFSNTIDFGTRNGNPEDIYKNIAFQLGQMLSFKYNVDVYSKEEIIDLIPQLKTFIQRDVNNYEFDNLQFVIDELNSFVRERKEILNLDEYTYEKSY